MTGVVLLITARGLPIMVVAMIVVAATMLAVMMPMRVVRLRLEFDAKRLIPALVAVIIGDVFVGCLRVGVHSDRELRSRASRRCRSKGTWVG